MYTEIERKWLVDIDKIPYDLTKEKGIELQQAYVSFSPTIRIRSIDSESFVLTVKGEPAHESALQREEFEIRISAEEYAFLMKKTEGTVITKTRYKIKEGAYTQEIDLFHGELEGLCYLEIEFPSVEEAESYPNPEWVKRDVSKLKDYTNGSLAKQGMPKDI